MEAVPIETSSTVSDHLISDLLDITLVVTCTESVLAIFIMKGFVVRSHVILGFVGNG